jgi:plastocyanin
MIRRTRIVVMTLAAVGATGLAACGNGAPETSSSGGGGGGCTAGTAGTSAGGTAATKVSATDQLQFAPATGTAKVGTVVEWSNTGSVLHNITFDGSASCLSDSAFQPGGTWQVKFTAAGTYTYHCTIHPGMDGKLTVS